MENYKTIKKIQIGKIILIIGKIINDEEYKKWQNNLNYRNCQK